MIRRAPFVYALLLGAVCPVASAGIAVGGRVVGPRGAPVAEAEVVLLPSPDPVQRARLADAGALPKAASKALTDSQGRFELSAPQAGLWTVRVQAPGHVPVEAALEPLIEPMDLPDAELLADVPVTVKITDPNGLPLPGARVRLAAPASSRPRLEASVWQPSPRTAITDPSGLVRLPRGEKEPSVLTASAAGHVLDVIRNLRGTAASLKLRPGIERTIQVVSADGAPASGVLVLAAEHSHPLGYTDAKGMLSVPLPARGTIALSLVAEDGRRVEGRADDQSDAAETGPRKGGRATTRAQREGSSPEGADPSAPSANPSAASANPSALSANPSAPAAERVRQSADAGEDAPSGGASASASRAGSLREGSRPPRRFTLPERIAVKGRVVDARDRRPIRDGLVWVMDEIWGAVATDAAGGYTLRCPGKRSLEVQAGAPGYLRPDRPFLLGPEARTGPTVALKPAAAIEGVVRDEQGQPVAGAEVRVDVKRGGDRMIIRMGPEPPAPTAVTSSRGTFRLSPVNPENNYDLKATASGFAPSRQEIVGLEPHRTLSGVRVELSRGQTVLGRAVDREGQPVRDADVSLRPARRGREGAMMMMEAPGASAQGSKGTTDGNGRFRIAGLASGTFELELRRGGFAKRVQSGVDVPKQAEPIDLGDLVMDRGERIHGIVSAPDGAPIEGVEVSLAAQSSGPVLMMGRGRGGRQAPVAVTGPDGRFLVEDLPPGEAANLGFNRTGYLPKRESGIDVPRVDPVLVTLQPASKVSGRVLGPDKKPVPGAQVTLTRTSSGGIGNEMFKMISRESDDCDDQGGFLFENVEPGQISLGGEAPGWQEAKLDGVEVPQGKDVEGVELPLKPGAVVTGRILAPDGRPAIGASIDVVSDDPEPIRFGGVASDGDGNYRLDGLAPGRTVVEATHEDYVRTVKEIEARPGSNKLDLQFEGGQEVSGSVTDGSGTPIAGAAVQLFAAGRYWGGPDTKSAADGSFKLIGVGDGDYQLRASREGYAPAPGDLAVHVAGKPVAGLRVQLGTGGSISGTVSGLSPEKLAQVDVQAWSSGQNGRASSAVDARGAYRLDNLLPGAWTVTASLPGTGQQTRSQTTLEAGAAESRLDLQFGVGLTLSGRAVQGEAPVKGAVLFAQGTDVNHSGWGRTGADGAFRIEGLEPGTYRLELRQWETGLSHDQTVELTSSREITVTIPAARVIGRVVDGSDSRPIAGVTVTLTRPGQGPARGPMERGATSDLSGRFEIANLADGSWSLTANKTGYAAASTDVNVQNGHDVDDLRLALDSTEGLTLDVRLPSGRVPDSVDVAILDPAGRSLTAGSYTTGENGRVRVSSVPPGSWDVVLSAAGSGTSSLRASVPGPPVAVALPPACALKVRVPALAGSTTAATATIKGADGRPFRSIEWMSEAIGEWRLSGGQLELDALPPGTWSVQVAASDGRTWSGTSSTQAGSPAEVVLQ